jgi:hypothetical protein
MTAVEQIYSFFENHDERVFLDFLREHKTYFIEMEKNQNTPKPVAKEESPKPPKFTVNTSETKS